MDETQSVSATPEEIKAIEDISALRLSIGEVLEDMADRKAWDGQPVGNLLNVMERSQYMEYARKSLMEARHWLGESLRGLPTGYRVTDNPKDKGSESKAA